jgi:hypothetical protein
MVSDNYWGDYAEFGDEAFNNTLASLLRTTALFDDLLEEETLEPSTNETRDTAMQEALALRSIALALQAVVLRLDRLESSRE